MGLLGEIGTRLGTRAMAPEAEKLFDATRRRLPRRLEPRQFWAEVVVAGAFAFAVVLFASTGGGGRVDAAVALTLVACLAVLHRVEFPVGSGWGVPTQLVFVPMLFLLPAAVVPPLVAGALVLGRAVDVVRGRMHPERLLLGVSDAWFSLGPAIVFAAASIDGFSWGDWPWWLLALAAQFAADFAGSAAREWLHIGKPPKVQLHELALVWLVDLALAPVGILAAQASQERRFSFLLVLPLVATMAAFAQERRTRIEQALQLSRAYQGTALLLGDVIEDDDHYTGEHSRGVVALALDISDELRLDGRQRRLVELGALLHDVGKIAVPNAIINKSGPLDDAEWEIMRSHTVEGQRMLDRVGGELTDVGVVVRATHEQFDGGGYPDGLAGEAIPLAARVVAVADAYSAMTTDRSYRRALARAEAASELRRHSGTQFDPRIVDAALSVLARRAVLEGEDPLVVFATH